MIIVDRSFSDLYEVAYHKFKGFMAILMFKLGTFGWDSDNHVRFHNRGIQSDTRRDELLKKGFLPPAPPVAPPMEEEAKKESEEEVKKEEV